MNGECVINVAEQFTDAPGGRYRKDGDFSGEEFREEYLEKLFNMCETLTVILDGAYGYPTSFLEEAFGGLVRKYGRSIVRSKLKFISSEDPLLTERIHKYIDSAEQ